MKDEDMDYSTGTSRTFKFDHPVAATIVMTTIKLMLLAFVVGEVMARDYLGSFVWFCGLLLFVLMGLVNIIVTSDIVIDDVGISRVAFGKSWQRIAWNNVKYITILESLDRRGRGFNVYPISKPKPSLLLNGKMAFSDEMERLAEFIKLMNFYISANNIKIQSLVGGVKTYPAQL